MIRRGQRTGRSCGGGTDGPMPQRGTRACWAPRWGFVLVVYMNKCDRWTIRSSGPGGLEVGRLKKYEYRGTRFGDPGSAKQARDGQGKETSRKVDLKRWSGDSYIPEPERAVDSRSLRGGRFRLGRGTVGTGCGEGKVRSGTRWSWGLAAEAGTGTGVARSASDGTRRSRENIGCAARGGEEASERGGWWRGEVDHPQRSQGLGSCDEGGGGRHTPSHGYAAVLLPDEGRDGIGDAADGAGDGMRETTGRWSDHADGRRGARVRDPRGAHGRRRRVAEVIA